MCSSLIKRGFWLWLTLILLGGTSTWAQIYVSSQGGDVFVVNSATGAVAATLQVSGTPAGMATTPVWIRCLLRMLFVRSE
jgi:YVTN family beta-propeller protein